MGSQRTACCTWCPTDTHDSTHRAWTMHFSQQPRGVCTLLVGSRVLLPGAAQSAAAPPSPSQQVRLSQNGVGLVVRIPSSAPRLLHPLSLGAGHKAGRAPLRAREPCPQSPGWLLQNHGAAHCLQGRLDLLGLGLGHVGFDFLRQGFHQLLCLPEIKVRTRPGPGPV